MKRVTDVNVIRACIFGHAVGDALGVPVEFSYREALDKAPVTGMRAYGTYNMPAGTWSDDTSMTLCALHSLGKTEFSWDDVMRNFVRWRYYNEFTPAGDTFDVGNTSDTAIMNYSLGFDYDICGRRGERDNGNGSLMRIIPFALYDGYNAEFIETASALTHAHKRSKIACVIYSFVLRGLIEKKDKTAVYDAIEKARAIYKDDAEWSHYSRLDTIADVDRTDIKSSGYVVNTLEAALWSFLTTDSYSDCVLRAVNLGRDTDTVAAVAGGLAGAYYGYDAIPQEWVDTLKNKALIDRLCENAAIAFNII